MNYMIMFPGGNMGIVVDTHVYGVAEAMEKFPGVTNDLIAAGEFHDSGTLVDNRYYTDEPTFEFRVNLHTDYPEQYLVDDVTQCGEKFGCRFGRRSFNWCYLKTYNYGCAVAFKDWSEVSRPGWSFVIEEPKETIAEETLIPESEKEENGPDIQEEPVSDEGDGPVMGTDNEQSLSQEEESPIKQSVVDAHAEYFTRPTPKDAVLDEEAIKAAVITPELDFSDLPHPKPEDDIEPVVQETVVESGIVPEECKGETWAQTWKHCRPEQVVSDVYCIEHNWEKRGDYYVIDCVMTGNRLIHSDKHGVNFAVPAKSCR